MNDPYATLGVAKNATPEEIKSAWRREASRAHPDREGGDPEHMARLNVAYETLSSPESRERYDSTGEQGAVKPMRARGVDAMMGAFQSVLLNDGDPVIAARQVMQDELQEMSDMIVGATRRLSQLREKRERLKFKAKKTKKAAKGEQAPTNVLHVILDGLMMEVKRDIDRFSDRSAVLIAAIDVLKDYDYDAPEPPDFGAPPSWSQAHTIAGPSASERNRIAADFWKRRS